MTAPSPQESSKTNIKPHSADDPRSYQQTQKELRSTGVEPAQPSKFTKELDAKLDKVDAALPTLAPALPIPEDELTQILQTIVKKDGQYPLRYRLPEAHAQITRYIEQIIGADEEEAFKKITDPTGRGYNPSAPNRFVVQRRIGRNLLRAEQRRRLTGGTQ